MLTKLFSNKKVKCERCGSKEPKGCLLKSVYNNQKICTSCIIEERNKSDYKNQVIRNLYGEDDYYYKSSI